jgi:hypothetical protein
MQTTCPNCERLNHIDIKSNIENNGFEYSCSCGYFLYCSNTDQEKAFKQFNDELIKARQEKLRGFCGSCSE